MKYPMAQVVTVYKKSYLVPAIAKQKLHYSDDFLGLRDRRHSETLFFCRKMIYLPQSQLSQHASFLDDAYCTVNSVRSVVLQRSITFSWCHGQFDSSSTAVSTLPRENRLTRKSSLERQKIMCTAVVYMYMLKTKSVIQPISQALAVSIGNCKESVYPSSLRKSADVGLTSHSLLIDVSLISHSLLIDVSLISHSLLIDVSLVFHSLYMDVRLTYRFLLSARGPRPKCTARDTGKMFAAQERG